MMYTRKHVVYFKENKPGASRHWAAIDSLSGEVSDEPVTNIEDYLPHALIFHK